MVKKVGILIFIVSLLLVILNPCLVQAQEGITVTDNSTQENFPSRLTFHLSAQGSVNISDIRLRYVVQRTKFAEVTSEVFIEFMPSTAVALSWSLEMVKIGGLPPGAVIDYWWVIQDISRKKIETAPQRVYFNDGRFSWKMTSWGGVTIYWYLGDEAFAQEMVKATQNATSRLASYTGAHLEKPVNLFIYANADDLQEGMIFPQEWTGGVAFTRYNTLAIAIAPNRLDWGRKTIAHELTHLIVDQITFNPYNDLPVWLEEGLAMYVEGEMEPSMASAFKRALSQNRLISLRSLSSPFSAYAGESALSYAESYSVVEFLVNKYGQSKMLELLNAFKKGVDYDGAFKTVYGFDMDGLETLWRDSLAQKVGLLPQTMGVWSAYHHRLSVQGLVGMPVLAVLVLAVKIRTRERSR